MKKYIIFLFLLFIPTMVKAGCSDDDLIRLQKLTNNITTSYEYNEEQNNFTITFSNISPELVITDINNKKNYQRVGDLSINDIESGNHVYYIYAYDKNCYDNELGTKTINLPYYNKYYADEECKGINNYKYCLKWLPNEITYNTWHSNVVKYKKSIEKKEQSKSQIQNNKTIVDNIRDIIVDLYVSKYYIFLPITILALCVIIYLKNKSDQLI